MKIDIMKIENSSAQALRRAILESHEVFTIWLANGRPVCKNAGRLEHLRKCVEHYNKHIAGPSEVKLRVKLHTHDQLPLSESTSAKVYINNVY